jgi:hypothetical protein
MFEPKPSTPRCPSCSSSALECLRDPQTGETIREATKPLARCRLCGEITSVPPHVWQSLPGALREGDVIEGDIPCPACGYDLKTLTVGHRCPECGRQITGHENTRSRRWSLPLIPSAILFLPFLIALVIAGFINTNEFARTIILLAGFGCFVIAKVILAIRRRRKA